jgi:SAM-dependent methyltransferase
MADYGNWVTRKLIFGTLGVGVVFLLLSTAAPAFLLISAPFLVAGAYFAYARWLFASDGGNWQERIRCLALDRLEWDGRGGVLDVGCGNGPLAIETAKRFPDGRVLGVDFWGGMWEYSLAQCEENAQREGVSSRVSFRKADASRLPFPDEAFDAVVSNFVFHEVQGVKDKREVVREALRVLRKGGVFAFQDLFLSRQFYGEPEDLLAFVRSCGVEAVKLEKTGDLDSVPRALRLPFMVGSAAILSGRK